MLYGWQEQTHPSTEHQAFTWIVTRVYLAHQRSYIRDLRVC